MDNSIDLPSESLEHYNDELQYSPYQDSFYEVLENCVFESMKSVFSSLYIAFICCTLFGIVTTYKLPEIYFDILSTLCGICLLSSVIQSKRALIIFFILIILFYFIIYILKIVQDYTKRTRYWKFAISSQISAAIQYIFIALFVLIEYTLLDKNEWLEIRGPMMIFSMKLISLFTLMQLESNLNQISVTPVMAYCGYVLFPGNVLFGPWTDFQHYNFQKRHPFKKGISWLLAIGKAFAYSFLCLTISNCWSSYFIDDTSNRWLLGFKDALTFRTSHYFVSYLSEAMVLMAGFKENNKLISNSWGFTVVSPMGVEFPNALSTVVIDWNKPMHAFFKKEVYQRWLPSGKFYAILLTFLISSLLHGLDFRIMIILICLSVFSYLETSIRNYLSLVFNICIKIYPCTPTCKHNIKRHRIISKLVLLFWSLLAVFHLMFLGSLMDETTNEIGIYEKLNSYYFSSFWIAAVQFLIIV